MCTCICGCVYMLYYAKLHVRPIVLLVIVSSIHRALEAASHLGGEDLEPFYALLEGGRYGDFYAEMEEYFYYAQIKR